MKNLGVKIAVLAMLLSESAFGAVTAVGRMRGAVVIGFSGVNDYLRLYGDQEALDGCYKAALMALNDPSLSLSKGGSRSMQPQRVGGGPITGGFEPGETLTEGFGCVLYRSNADGGRFGSACPPGTVPSEGVGCRPE